jgi:hypothetical protein
MPFSPSRLLAATTSELSEATARNVIILIIDGLRNDEAFDDPSHQYIPHIWNDLRPKDTINTNFWNTGLTVTTPAHHQIVTGVRELLKNQSGEIGQIRAKYPNIFEYYRKQKNVPESKVWVVAGKNFLTKNIHASLHPDYANLGGSSESLNTSDLETWISVQQKMDTYHPSLMLINLKDVDVAIGGSMRAIPMRSGWLIK